MRVRLLRLSVELDDVAALIDWYVHLFDESFVPILLCHQEPVLQARLFGRDDSTPPPFSSPRWHVKSENVLLDLV